MTTKPAPTRVAYIGLMAGIATAIAIASWHLYEKHFKARSPLSSRSPQHRGKNELVISYLRTPAVLPEVTLQKEGLLCRSSKRWPGHPCEAAKVLTDEQRQMLLGTTKPAAAADK